MVRYLISAAFLGAALVRGRVLCEGGACFDLTVNGVALVRGWCSFEDRRLLEKMW